MSYLQHGIDDSCDLINRQLTTLFAFLEGKETVKADDVMRFFLIDPADEQGENVT